MQAVRYVVKRNFDNGEKAADGQPLIWVPGQEYTGADQELLLKLGLIEEQAVLVDDETPVLPETAALVEELAKKPKRRSNKKKEG